MTTENEPVRREITPPPFLSDFRMGEMWGRATAFAFEMLFGAASQVTADIDAMVAEWRLDAKRRQGARLLARHRQRRHA